MPNDSFMKLANTLHRFLIKSISIGKRGWDFYGMPVIKLTTIGRVSGKRQIKVMLTSPIKSNGDICLQVASKGGDDRHPEYIKSSKRPKSKVEAPSGTKSMIATIAEGDERELLWNQIVSDFPNYGSYQEKTNREIPVIILKENSGTS